MLSIQVALDDQSHLELYLWQTNIVREMNGTFAHIVHWKLHSIEGRQQFLTC
jgi:hypothetical protein